MTQSCTFVTAFYQVRDVPKQGNMMERGALLLACDVHLVVYCSPEDYPEFRAQREKHGLLDKTEFVVRAFEQIPFYEHREQIERNREAYWPTRNARAPTDVHIICMSKFEFVREVAERNPFATTHVGWVDFRLLGEHCKPQELLAVANAPRPRFTVTVMNCWTPSDYTDLRAFYAQYRYIVCGGMWTADVVSAQNLLPTLIAHAERVTLAGYGHGEEAIFAFAIDEQPDAFTLTIGDYQNITGNYFGVAHNHGYCRWVFEMWRQRAPARAAQLARDARLFLTPQSQQYRAELTAVVPTLPTQPRRIAVVVILNLAHPFDKFYAAWEEYARWTERQYDGLRVYFAMSTEGYGDVERLSRCRLPSGAEVFFDPAHPLRVMSEVSENYHHALVVKTWNTFEYVLETWQPDYILRTNACSIWNWDRFGSVLDRTLGENRAYNGPCYAGCQGVHNENGVSTHFVSGAGFLCSWDVAQTLIGGERRDAIDDVWVGRVLHDRGVTPTAAFLRLDVGDEHRFEEGLQRAYHMRFCTPNRMEDVQRYRKAIDEWTRRDVRLGKIGVAIPCFAGHMDVLARCLRSIEQQSRKPDHVAIAFSECTEEHKTRLNALVSEFTFPIVLDLCESVRNAATNRNTAARKLTTEWVSFIDADDEMHPLRLELLENAMNAQPLSAILHYTQVCSCAGEPLTEFGELSDVPLIVDPYKQAGRTVTLLDIQMGPGIHAGHVTVKRDLCLKYPYDEAYRNPGATSQNKYLWIGEDLQFVLRLLNSVAPDQVGYLGGEYTRYHKLGKNAQSKHM